MWFRRGYCVPFFASANRLQRLLRPLHNRANNNNTNNNRNDGGNFRLPPKERTPTIRSFSTCYHTQSFYLPSLSPIATGGGLHRFTNNTAIVGKRRYSSMSYDSSRSDHAMDGSTIGEKLLEQVAKYPDRDMVVFPSDNVRYTYEQFKAKIDDLAAGLLAFNVKPGDRVGIWSPNRIEWVLTEYATALIGAILVNVNPAYRVGELEYALEKVGVKALVMAETFKTQDYYEMLFDLCPELMRCAPGQLKSHRLPELETVILTGEARKPGTVLFEDICGVGTREHRLEIENIAKKLHFDQAINIQFTSGTTGNPKAATLTHHNILNNARFIGLRMGYDKQHTNLCLPVPLYHCFGMVCGSMTCPTFGTTCVYPSQAFDPEALLQAVQDERCNVLYGTPTMFIDTLNLPNFNQYDKSSLRAGIMAGSPCPVEVMKQLISEMNMTEACVAYGSTETSPVTFLTYPDDPIDKRCGTIGSLLDHTEAKIVDEHGQLVPRGEAGELCTRGYSTMLGYWGDDAKTASAISPSRWYHTGDIASMDEDGYVTISGRIKDMVIRGGENIYPVEIEQFLYTHEDIEDVQIVGVPDKRLGEEICATIRLKDGKSLTEQEVKDFCKGKIAHFKIPRYVVFVESFPLTISGKVQKFVLREKLVKQLSLEHQSP